MTEIIFYLAAAVACLFAAAMVVHRNPVKSVLALVVSFFGLAVIYVLLSAPLIAAVQVIVYAGAILVLFLFVIMLLNLREEERGREERPVQRALGGGAIVLLTLILASTVSKTPPPAGVPSTLPAPAPGEVAPIARELFGSYLLPFEAVSVLLLVALVGALVLTRKGESE